MNTHTFREKIWNLWKEDIKAFAPRNNKGEWVKPFDPNGYQSQYKWIDPFFYEGTSMQWSFSVHHDFYGLIQRCGGTEKFIERLDKFFENGNYHSKETMLHIPYLYIYAGRPDKTTERVNECMAKYFKVRRDGLSDNEDMGCQSAFYMLSSMGLYPIMGQNLYLLTSPVFKHVEVDLGKSGKTLIIDAPKANSKNIYVKEIKLNGLKINRHWIRHNEIANGGRLEFELTDIPEDNYDLDLPPSPLKIGN